MSQQSAVSRRRSPTRPDWADIALAADQPQLLSVIGTLARVPGSGGSGIRVRPRPDREAGDTAAVVAFLVCDDVGLVTGQVSYDAGGPHRPSRTG